MGTIFGHDQKAYAKWSRASRHPAKGPALVGEALEAAVMRVASIFPDNVSRGVIGG